MNTPARTESTRDLLDRVLGSEERALLIDTPGVVVGVKSYQPGEVFPNHFHQGYDELFATLEGELVVWEGRATRIHLPSGTSHLCARGVHHYLVNESLHTAKLLYAKIPMIDDDVIWVEWSPEAVR